MPFPHRKVKTNRIFQDVVEQIQNAIISGDLKPGDILPSELKLTEMFSTSRGTIREALRVLEQKGLVEIKTGSSGGAIIKTVDTGKMVELLDLLVRSKIITIDHLMEFQGVVEGFVAGRAAEKATPEGCQTMQALISEFRGLRAENRADWKDAIRLDVQLHVAIAEIVGNPLFTAVVQMIHENIVATYERLFLKDESFFDDNVQGLCQIVEAITQGRAEDARSLSQQHVRKLNRYMEKRPEQTDEPMNKFRFNPASVAEKIVHGSERPGYPNETVGPDAIQNWIRFMQNKDIQRVCCLITKDQLGYYSEDLLGSYKQAFGNDNVCWAPVEDYSLVDTHTLKEKILPFLKDSEKKEMPVVVHCSGGIGRTGHILAAWMRFGRHFEIEQALIEVKKMDRNPYEAVESGHVTLDQLHSLLMTL